MKNKIIFTFLVCLLCLGLVSGGVISAKSTQKSASKSYYEIYRLLEARQARLRLTTGALPEAGYSGMDSGMRMEATAEDAVGNYSTTNLQELGVDEADVVKTDGKYIYALSWDKIHIIRADNGNLEKTAVITGENFTDMYLKDGRLAVIYTIYKEQEKPQSKGLELADCFIMQGDTGISLYDISDPKNPQMAGEYSQNGSLISSRMVGDSIYLVTTKNNYGPIERDKPETYIPSISEKGKFTLIPQEDIYVSPDISKDDCADNYLLVGGLSIQGDGEKTGIKALLGYGSMVYASPKNLYVSAYADLSKDGTQMSGTRLVRFALDAGKVTLAAEGEVPGTVDDQFSMDEEGAYFRVLTTVDSQAYISADGKYSGGREPTLSNSLFVLNLDLEEVGSLSGLAPNERIYSARFLGDMAYFVTFRNVDPLFAVDLSNPQKPAILSQLKIPGFSEYLHPFGEGLLLGIGQEADEKTGETQGVKLSMFDISDPKNVFETAKTLTKESYSEALYNHKAVLVDVEKNIIAFPGEDNYLIYSYDGEKGFTLNSAVRFGVGGESAFGNIRGLYIDNILYAVGYEGIAAIDRENYEIVNTLYF